MIANELIEENLEKLFVTKEINMAAGYVDDWHKHSWHQVIFPVSGLLQSNIENKKFIVPHNCFLFVPANEEHKSVAITNTLFLSIYLNPKCETYFPKGNKSGLVSSFFKYLILSFPEIEKSKHKLSVSAHLISVLQDQISMASDYQIPLLIPKDRRLLSVFLALQKQPSLELTLSDWALKVGASQRTLSRVCADEFNLSFSLWRQNIRLVLSLALLEENKPILQIALDLGYKSDSAYIYAFKKVFFQTPNQYRKNLSD